MLPIYHNIGIGLCGRLIVVPNLFGNGLSSSPSNTPAPYDRARFPDITYYHNIMCQHRLITEKFDVERIALVCGFSMGAQQSYHWGALFPDMVERIAPWCGSARTSRHNFVFLEGVKAALMADDAWRGGWYDRPPSKGEASGTRWKTRRSRGPSAGMGGMENSPSPIDVPTEAPGRPFRTAGPLRPVNAGFAPECSGTARSRSAGSSPRGCGSTPDYTINYRFDFVSSMARRSRARS